MNDEHISSALMDALLGIPAFKRYDSRSALLRNIPDAGACPRDAAETDDLFHIIDHVIARWQTSDGESLLDVFCSNAQKYANAKTKLGQQLVQSIQVLKDSRNTDRDVSLATDIPFANRRKELISILFSASAQHHLLDGSAGYGKTRLLLQLRSLFRTDQKFESAYATARTNRKLPELVKALCMDLKLDAESVVGSRYDPGRLAIDFANAVLNAKFQHIELAAERIGPNGSTDTESKRPQGLVLLIDDIGPDVKDLANALFGTFIPTLEKSLRKVDYFRLKKNRFRVIVSGRYLESLFNSMKWPLGLSPTSLKAFDDQVVHETACLVLESHDSDELKQLSAHILHLTGGHPDSIAKVLRFYQQHVCDPEDFSKEFSEMVWELVAKQADEVFTDLPEELREISLRLSVVRFFHVRVLSQLRTQGVIMYNKDDFGLCNDLTRTCLYNRGKYGILYDDIMRRLLVLRLRRNVGQNTFRDICRMAYQIYLSVLGDERLQGRERWAVECLYQALQQNIDGIGTPEERSELRTWFFLDSVLGEVLRAYVLDSDPGEQQEKLDTLIQEMNEERNWDFRLTVNYYLRARQYSGESFARLEDAVRSWRR